MPCNLGIEIPLSSRRHSQSGVRGMNIKAWIPAGGFQAQRATHGQRGRRAVPCERESNALQKRRLHPSNLERVLDDGVAIEVKLTDGTGVVHGDARQKSE